LQAKIAKKCFAVAEANPIGHFVAAALIPVPAWLGVDLIDERLRALLPVRR